MYRPKLAGSTAVREVTLNRHLSRGLAVVAALACAVCCTACGTDLVNPSVKAPTPSVDATTTLSIPPADSLTVKPGDEGDITNRLIPLLDATADDNGGLYRDPALGLVVNLKTGASTDALQQQISAVYPQMKYHQVPRSMNELKRLMDVANSKVMARSIPGAIGVRIDTGNNRVLLLSTDPPATQEAVLKDSTLPFVGVEAGQMSTAVSGG